MNIEEYKAKKLAMERKMTAALAEIVEEFERETGMTPHSISVHMMDVTRYGDKRRRNIVAAVETDIEI